MRTSITDPTENLEFNRARWGDPEKWSHHDHFGYQWAGGYAQKAFEVSRLADRFLRPHIDGRYDLKVLELSPGGGRFTAELIRYSASLDLLDMNQACIDVCRERFQYFPTPMRFYVNDGQSCEMVEDDDYDLIASFDSMVHAHPDIIAGYVQQLGAKLRQGGILWIDHSGTGAREQGHRTDMTPEKIASFAGEAGLSIVSQEMSNAGDCISVMRR